MFRGIDNKGNQVNVFLTGATGYIGGTIGHAFHAAGHRVVGLVRPGAVDRASALAARGIEPIAGDLGNAALLASLCDQAEVVINAANVDHRGCVETMLAALKGSGKVFIQTSGSGITADMAGGHGTDAVFEDDTPVRALPARQARVDLNALVLAAANDGVRSSVVAPPMVYGQGLGMHSDSIQVPAMIRAASKHEAGVYIGTGQNRWSNVHVADLADLYLAIAQRGEAGRFYYAENGENSMLEIAQAISRMLGLGGRTRSLTTAQAVSEYGEPMTHLSLGANSRVRATRARQALGWSGRRLPLLDEIQKGSYAQGRVAAGVPTE